MLMRKTEENLHLKICNYLRKNYPDVLFRTDFSSGMKMSPGQAAKHKKFQKSRAWPDLFIAESNTLASGLFLEIKAENVIVFKKNGEIRQNKHLIESAWRAIAIIALLLFSGAFGLFIGSEAELKSTKAKLNDTVNCQK